MGVAWVGKCKVQPLGGGGGVRCVVGTYTGTGSFGRNAPNSLTLPFEAQVIIIDAMVLQRGSAMSDGSKGPTAVVRRRKRWQ